MIRPRSGERGLVSLAAVLILAVLLLILVAVLIVLAVVLILVLIIHGFFLQISFAVSRYHSLPDISRFILGFENETDDQTGKDRYGDATGAGFESSGEDAEKAVFIDGFFHTLGKIIAESG